MAILLCLFLWNTVLSYTMNIVARCEMQRDISWDELELYHRILVKGGGIEVGI